MTRTRHHRFLRARLCAAVLIGAAGAQPIHISGSDVTDVGSLKKLIMDAFNVKPFQIVGLSGSNKGTILRSRCRASVRSMRLGECCKRSWRIGFN
jgi:hypothetical protein